MKLNKQLLAATFTFLLILAACGGGGDEPDPNPMRVLSASNLMIDDITNNGNASDIQISFDKANDESNIIEYRVILVKSNSANNFTIQLAEGLASTAYFTVAKTGNNIQTTLGLNMTDSEGQLVNNGQEYVAFVMSVADDSEETLNSLSIGSNVLPVGETSIKITYAGNMGVVISDGAKQVAIDAMHGNLGGWYQIETSDLIALQRGDAPWGCTDIVMTTHNHGDHFSSSAANSLLNAQPNALYIAPTNARGGISNSRIADTNPDPGTSVRITHNDIDVDVLRVTHFNQFGNDFSTVESYAFLVHIGGMKVLHLGDVLYDNDNLSPFDLANQDIDVVVIPTFNTLISASNREIIQNQVAPDHIIAIHLQTSTQISSVQNVYPNATIFTEATSFKRY